MNQKGKFNRKWLLALCIPLAFLLTGCIKLDMALTVNKDKTVSGAVIFAVADSLAALGSSADSPSGTGMNGLDNLIDKKAKGVSVSKYHEGGFTGEKFTFDHAPLKAFSSSTQKDGSFAIDIKGNQAFISGVLDLSSTGTQSTGSTSMDDAFTKAMFASAQVRIAVTFPGKITKSTGEISRDGRTVTWNPIFGDKTDLTTTVALDSPMNLIPWAIGGFFLIALVIWLIILNRRKSHAKPLENELETHPTENEGIEDQNIEPGLE